MPSSIRFKPHAPSPAVFGPSSRPASISALRSPPPNRPLFGGTSPRPSPPPWKRSLLSALTPLVLTATSAKPHWLSCWRVEDDGRPSYQSATSTGLSPEEGAAPTPTPFPSPASVRRRGDKQSCPVRGDRPSDCLQSFRPTGEKRPWVMDRLISGRLGVRCKGLKTLWGARRRPTATSAALSERSLARKVAAAAMAERCWRASCCSSSFSSCLGRRPVGKTAKQTMEYQHDLRTRGKTIGNDFLPQRGETGRCACGSGERVLYNYPGNASVLTFSPTASLSSSPFFP